MEIRKCPFIALCHFGNEAFLSFFQLSDHAPRHAHVGKILQENIAVFGVEGIQAVTAEDLEEAASIQNKDAKLAKLHRIGFLHQQNIAVAVARLH